MRYRPGVDHNRARSGSVDKGSKTVKRGHGDRLSHLTTLLGVVGSNRMRGAPKTQKKLVLGWVGCTVFASAAEPAELVDAPLLPPRGGSARPPRRGSKERQPAPPAPLMRTLWTQRNPKALQPGLLGGIRGWRAGSAHTVTSVVNFTVSVSSPSGHSAVAATGRCLTV
eukprot:1183022-Prorocentrum_minimum.AAC.3